MLLPPNSPTICLDAGHGPDLIHRDEGYHYNFGSEANGLQEQALTWALVQDVIHTWDGPEVEWFQTRKTYWDAPSLQDRADAANAHGVDLFVSIHFNWFREQDAQGLEVWHYPSSALGKKCAFAVLSKLVLSTGAFCRGLQTREQGKTSFYVLRHTHAPAILIEMGFLSNHAEAAAIKTKAYWNQMVSGVVAGLKQCLIELGFKNFDGGDHE